MRFYFVLLVAVPSCAADPVEILTARANVSSRLVVDDSYLYWTLPDINDAQCAVEILRMPIGGGPETVLIDRCCARDLAVADGTLYWADASEDPNAVGGIFRVAPTDAGAVRVAGDGNAAWHLALDATSVYWTGRGNGVLRAPRAGGGAQTLASQQLGYSNGIADDGASVYWTVDMADAFGHGAIFSVPEGGGATESVAGPLGGSNEDVGFDPEEVVVDGGQLYFTATDQVAVVPATGGAVQTLASGSWVEQAFALDADFAYWNDALGGRLMRVARRGGPMQTLADHAADGEGLVVTSDYVYVTGSEGIGRVAKGAAAK